MSSYDALAASYDALTVDVEYRRRADYLTRQFHRSAFPVETVLDLACGTGTMACLLAERGYRMIAVDGCSCPSPCPACTWAWRWMRRSPPWTR